MEPAQPPFPTAWNFPFHLSAGGSQSSMLIRESDEGFRTATTLQCAGAIIGAAVLRASRLTSVPRACHVCVPRERPFRAEEAEGIDAFRYEFRCGDRRVREGDRFQAFAGCGGHVAASLQTLMFRSLRYVSC